VAHDTAMTARRRPVTTVFLLRHENRYSINALAGALEVRGEPETEVRFVQDDDAALEALSAAARRGSLPVLCVSYACMAERGTLAAVGRVRKALGSTVFVVAGGPQPSGAPEKVLEAGCDAVVIGEGEEALPTLLAELARGGDGGIPGVFRLRDARAGGRPRRARPVELDRYPPISVRYRRFGPIEISRGCPHACLFCQTSRLHGTRMRHRSTAAILEAVRLMCREGKRAFRAITPDAFAYGSCDGIHLNVAAVAQLLEHVRAALGPDGQLFFGSFPSEVRPEHVTVELLTLVHRYANNDNIVIGARSGSPRMLQRLHRGHTVDDVVAATEAARQAGFKVYVDFIFGLPDETDDDRAQTLALMRRLADAGARLHAHTFMPLAGTRYGDRLPGAMDPALRREVHRLMHAGALFGRWEQQERFVRGERPS